MGSDSRPSFRLDRFGADEQIVIPARLFNGQMLGLATCFVAVPLVALVKFAGVTIVGGWKGAWIVVGVALLLAIAFAVLQIVWWLAGTERIAVVAGDLRVRHAILGLPVAARTYRGDEILFLAPTSYMPPSFSSALSLPFLGGRGRGALKFRYRGATIYIAHDLLPMDARALADWLGRRLPNGAVETIL